MYQVSPHGKLSVPNNKDYNIDPNTYDGEFFQEDGLQGCFEIDLTRLIGTEVDDDEMDVDEDARDEVYNAKDLELLEQLQLGLILTLLLWSTGQTISTCMIVMMRLMI